jgi:hypothetical protein
MNTYRHAHAAFSLEERARDCRARTLALLAATLAVRVRALFRGAACAPAGRSQAC